MFSVKACGGGYTCIIIASGGRGEGAREDGGHEDGVQLSGRHNNTEQYYETWLGKADSVAITSSCCY